MELSAAERSVVQRYREKTRIAGGARVGYVLRRDAIRYRRPESDEELAAALEALVEKGVLAASEDGSLFFLTESGVALLEEER